MDTQTYLFTNHVLDQPDEIPGYPSHVMRTSRSTSATLNYGMDPEIARDPAYRERLLDGLESIPSISLVLPKEHMFGQGGIYYATDGNGPTHAASVEVLYADEPGASCQVDCGLESHATVAVKRSFKLKFQSEFGPGKLVNPFFRGSPLNGDSATNVIDRIVLRAGNERTELHYPAIYRELCAILPKALAETLMLYTEPSLIVSYKREYYEALDSPLRVTLDSDIQCFDQSGLGRPRMSFGQPLAGLVILEGKTPVRLEELLPRLLYPLRPVVTRSSKYVMGCDALGLVR